MIKSSFVVFFAFFIYSVIPVHAQENTDVTFPAFVQDTISVELTQQQQIADQQLQTEASNVFIHWDQTNNVPKWVRMTNLDIDWHNADYVERAYQFLDDYGVLYKIENPRLELQQGKKKEDELGMTHVTLQQTHKGIPVYGGQIQFHFLENGNLSSIGGNYIPFDSEINAVPTISSTSAKQIAEQAVYNQLGSAETQHDDLELESTKPKLYFYNHGIFSQRQEDTYLVWIFSVYSETALMNQLFYINAQDGSVVNQINNIQTSKDIDTLVLADCNDEIGTLTYTEASSSESDTVGSASTDAQGWEVNGYTGLVYDYYFDTFGRDSFDDTNPDDPSDGGGVIISYTHVEVDENHDGVCEQVVNAAWDPTAKKMGYGEDFISLDVAGHELTHAVVQYSVGTTDDDTLTYEYETGALNESYADAFGELIEFANGGGDWLLGTDLPNGPSRDFADPNMGAYDRTQDYNAETNYGQPSHVGEQAQVTDQYCSSRGGDNGCLHLNSGITNNAFYLIVEGGTNPYSGDGVATGIGIDAAQQIYYRALTTYLDITSDFQDSYQATMQSCLDLNDSDPNTYPISYCQSVFDAFAAVGINTDTSYAWASITASATKATTSTAITFDGADSVGINSTITDYIWDFDDGTTAVGGAISHTFTDPGTYNVTLTIIDSVGYVSNTTIAITIYVTDTINSNSVWSVDHNPYIINQDVIVASGYTLIINPGVIIKFYDINSSLTVSGELSAVGNSVAPIVFTSYKDDAYGGDTNGDGSNSTPAAGDWSYICVDSGGTVNLDYVTVQYGGFINTFSDNAMLLINDVANAAVDHSTLQYSQYYTMEIDPDSNSTIQNSTITNSANQRAIYVMGGTSNITNNTISSTNSYGVYIDNAFSTISNNNVIDSRYGIYVTGSSSAPIIMNNVFSGNIVPISLSVVTSGTTLIGNTGSENVHNIISLGWYPVGDVTLNNSNELSYYMTCMFIGDNLTIEPGVIIKLQTGCNGAFFVSGSLTAIGTTDEPIVFTSYKDDDYGGDTNGDGSTTSPVAGDWPSVEFYSGSSGILSNVIMLYGGGMININSNNVLINDSYLANAEIYAINITSATPTITNNIIVDCGNYGIHLSGGNPSITQNVITGHNWYGIYINSGSPALTQNTIVDNGLYGLYNISTSTITAESNWWGSSTGPYNATTNPTGTGNTVSNNVDFTPWLTVDPAADITPPAEVTLGTSHNDVWNKSITLNWTNPTDTDFSHVRIDRTDVAAGTTTTLSSTETGTSYNDTTLSYNLNYTYTLYTVDTTGNVSTGVTTTSQRVRSPAPTSLTLTAGNASITASWAASSAPASTLQGYKVYYGTSPTALTSVVTLGKVTTTTLTGLTNGTRYYVAVTAVSKTGLESPQSVTKNTRPHP